MNCRYCNAENDEDAVFCINCGKKLDGKLNCPSCGAENEGDAKFCKECGQSLLKSAPKKDSVSKEKGLSIGNLVFKIVAVSMAAFVILFCFGSCFAPFLSCYGKGMNLFDFIKDLKSFKPKPSGTYGADFYMLGETLPNIICISGISLALVGCITALIWGSVKAILTGMKKQIPNLDHQGLLATCSLLMGMLFSGLIFMYSKTPANTLVSGSFTIKYGGIVLAAVSVGLAWYFLNYIGRFVLDFIKGLTKKEILNRAFKFGEAALLCVILFNLCSSFLSFTRIEESWSGAQTKYITGMSIGAFFTTLSESVYHETGDVNFIFSESGVAGGYYFALAILVVFIVVLVASVILIFIRMKNNSNKTKASLGTAIPLVVMAVAELVLTLVAISVFSKSNGVFYLLQSQGSSIKKQVGGSIIVFMVFSFLVLALEIVWLVLSKIIKDDKESEAYDM